MVFLPQISTESYILEVRDFEATDVLGGRSSVVVEPNASPASEEEASLQLFIRLSDVILHPQDEPLRPEESREAGFPQEEEETPVKGFLHELVANVEVESLICDTDYITNSCFIDKNT